MARSSHIKDIYLEQAVFNRRMLVLLALIILLTGALTWRLLKLQVIDHAHYSTLSHNNRISIAPAPPTRGLIYDRNGTVIADNLPSFDLVINPQHVRSAAGTLQRLSKILDISELDVQQFNRLRKVAYGSGEIPLKVNLSEEEVARFQLDKRNFPGVSISAHTRRYYPYGETLSHVLGYVGRINEQDKQVINSANYRGTSYVGKTGIERQFEAALHGQTGVTTLEVDARGRKVRTLAQTLPKTGEALKLSIDLRLQQKAHELMTGKSGALVAMDPRNGEVLAMVSEPGFNNNLFVTGMTNKDFARLRDNQERPLFNRVTQGQYPPGSTIKPITALSGLEAGITTFRQQMYAAGYYQIPDDPRRYRDWREGGHGWVDMDAAITQSSDVYFYDLSYKLGIDTLSKTFKLFGLGKRTGIELRGETAGLVPDRAWKRARQQKPWFPGETLIVGIGQGYMLASPLQLARMTSCVAMRGICQKPTLLARPEPGTATKQPELIQLEDEAHWDQIIEAMEHVVHAPNGTARVAGSGAQYKIAGKTGTSQVFGLKEGEKYDEEKLPRRLRDHALFVGFAPAQAPRIAVAVIVEHGGHGSSAAAPLARAIMDEWLSPD
ncbi:MAG: penicillin-binding protein 2 [Thiotrichales bacterium]